MSKEYQRELYYWCKERHICTKCMRMDAFTLNGRILCAECAKRQCEQKYEKYHTDAAYRDNRVQKQRDRAQVLKEAGICTKCGKRPVSKGHVVCDRCRARKRSKTIHKYLPPGICTRCRKEPAMQEKKVCLNCYEALSRIIKEAGKKRDMEGHIWHKYNDMVFGQKEVKRHETQ